MSEPYLRSSRTWPLWVTVGFLWLAGLTAFLRDEQFESWAEFNPFMFGLTCLLIADSVWFYAICAGFRSPTQARWWSSAALFGVGLLALLFKSPAQMYGLDTEELGWLLVIMGLASASFTAASAEPRADSQMTLGEKTALASLLTNTILGGYLFTLLRDLHPYSDGRDASFGKFVTVVIAVLIIEAIALDTLRHLQGEGAVEDERDTAIAKQAASIAYKTLAILLTWPIIAMGLFPYSWSGWDSSVATAHALIGVLLLASMVQHATAIWLYRRDRR